MQRDPIREVVLAVVFFGALALVAWAEGVFERLGSSSVALMVFALAYAAMTWWLDGGLRDAVRRRFPARGRRVLRSAPAKSPAPKRAAT